MLSNRLILSFVTEILISNPFITKRNEQVYITHGNSTNIKVRSDPVRNKTFAATEETEDALSSLTVDLNPNKLFIVT